MYNFHAVDFYLLKVVYHGVNMYELCTSLNSNFTGKRSGIFVNPIIADGASEDYCSLCLKFLYM